MIEILRSKLASYLFVGAITTIYSTSEIAIGLYLRSLLVLSDGFHNLSDVGALAIAYASEKASEKTSSSTMTFGWLRMKIVGGLINSTALITLGVYIALDAIPKFIFPEVLTDPIIIIIVGAVGVVLNTVGSLIFGFLGVGDDDSQDHGHNHSSDHVGDDNSDSRNDGHKQVEQGPQDSNIFAVFVHYLGDAVSSLFVLIAGILVLKFNAPWVAYIDPVASCLVVIIIISSAIKPVRVNALTLLQAVPRTVNLNELTNDLLKIDGVVSIHDLHLWEMVDGLPIVSAHVVAKFATVNDDIKTVFHNYNIHSSTVQVELTQNNLITDSTKSVRGCKENCVQSCSKTNCCKKDQ